MCLLEEHENLVFKAPLALEWQTSKKTVVQYGLFITNVLSFRLCPFMRAHTKKDTNLKKNVSFFNVVGTSCAT